MMKYDLKKEKIYVISLSIQVLTDGKLTLHNEHGIPILLNGLYVDVCTQLGWKGLVTYLTKITISS